MSIEYRGDGKYRFRVTKGGQTYTRKFEGKILSEKEIKEKKYPKTVEYAHEDFKVDVRKGNIGLNENMKFKDLYESVKEDYFSEDLSASTQDNYDSIATKHLIPVFGETKIIEIEKHEIQKFINEKKKKYMPRTIHSIYATISSIFSKAVEWNVINANPCNNIKLPEIEKTDYSELLSESEISRLLQVYDKDPNTLHKLFFYIAVGCGLRHGEILGLKISDIDFKKNIINVSKQMGRIKNKQNKTVRAETKTKTKNSVRKIYAPDFVLTAAKEHIKQMNPIPLSGHLFWDYDRNCVISQRHTKDYFLSVLRQNGIKEIRVHDLRHLKATIMLHAGSNVVTVARTLGDTIETIIRNYTHTIDEAEIKSAKDFENMISEIKSK